MLKIRVQILIFFLLILVGPTLFAQDLSFESELGSGVYWGRAEEIVYKKPLEPDKLSLLTWDVPVFQTLDVSTQLHFPFNVFLRAKIQIGFAYTSAVMRDLDWINVPDSEDPDIFSDSVNYLVSWAHGTADLGWVVLDSSPIKITSFLTYLYLLSAWEGWNSVQGQKNVPGTTTYYGHTIDFRQIWHGVGLGGLISMQLFDANLLLELKFFPWVVYLSRDIHILTSKTYLDNAYWGQGIKISTGYAVPFGERYFGKIGFQFLRLWSGYGDSILSNNGDTNPNTAFTLYKNAIGGTYQLLGLFLGLGFVIQ